MNRKYKNGWKSTLPKCEICGKRLSTRKAVRCQKCYTSDLLGPNNPVYGRKHTEEWKIKIHKSRKAYRPTEETKRKISEYNKRVGKEPPHLFGEDHWNWKGGLPKCVDCGKMLTEYNYKRCKSCGRKGNRTHLWKGGITPLAMGIRSLLEYKRWRDSVYKRDDYTCQECGDKSRKEHSLILEAHHIKEFSLILAEFLQEYDQFSPVEDRDTLVRLAMKYEPFFDICNGKTLCKKCHDLTKNGKKSHHRGAQ